MTSRRWCGRREPSAVTQESAGDSHHGHVLAGGPVEERARGTAATEVALRFVPTRTCKPGLPGIPELLNQAMMMKGMKR
jgi:hypothetical protein